jgi:mono/diheme cytochrome c family protein
MREGKMSAKWIMKTALAIGLAAAWSIAAGAAETPHETWIKVKCAVCHGEDGSGNTPNGKRTNTPDLRTPEVQKKSDGELRGEIEKGHARMPAFSRSLTPQEVTRLVYYIRSIALK